MKFNRLFLVVPLVGASLTACSVPGQLSMSKPKPHNSPAPKATPVAISTPVGPIEKKEPVPSIFDAGSVTQVLPAGAYGLGVTFSVNQDTKVWQYKTAVPVSVSAHLQLAAGSTTVPDQQVNVGEFKATLFCGDKPLVLRDDSGASTITPPYTYNTSVTVQCPDVVDKAVLHYEITLNVETYKKSNQFYRQVTLGDVPIAFNNEETK